MADAKRPTKVQLVVDRIERSDWTLDSVEQMPGETSNLWIVRAHKGGPSVFTRDDLTVYIAVCQPYTIPGTDLRMRYAQRLQGGHVDAGVGSHRDLKTWRDVRIATWPR